jgi:coenzyme F420-reducing hydrogenase gamma subunit
MSRPSRLQLAYVRFTSCSGCQLMLLNCEGDLARLLSDTDVHEFPLASSSAVAPGVKLDLALVEGSISTPQELCRLMDLRRRAGLLVAVGSCALSGGINALVPGERGAAVVDVYGEELTGLSSFPPQPVHRFVTVDFAIPGCPPERHDLLAALLSATVHGWPGRQMMPVCMDCRILENRCLLVEDHLPCLGPVTRAGCRARCPSVGVGCEGCRGDVEEANRVEMFRLLLEAGLSERDVSNRLSRFAEERR